MEQQAYTYEARTLFTRAALDAGELDAWKTQQQHLCYGCIFITIGSSDGNVVEVHAKGYKK